MYIHSPVFLLHSCIFNNIFIIFSNFHVFPCIFIAFLYFLVFLLHSCIFLYTIFIAFLYFLVYFNYIRIFSCIFWLSLYVFFIFMKITINWIKISWIYPCFTSNNNAQHHTFIFIDCIFHTSYNPAPSYIFNLKNISHLFDCNLFYRLTYCQPQSLSKKILLNFFIHNFL